MSLLNDMLRDLEARDARPPVKSVRHTGTDRRRRRAVPVLGDIALLATGLLAVWLIRDVPAGDGAAPDHEPGPETNRESEFAPTASPAEPGVTAAGAVSDRDPFRTRNEPPADPAVVGAVSRPRPNPDPAATASAPATQPPGAVSDREPGAETNRESEVPPTTSPAEPGVTAVRSVSDRDQPRTRKESPTDSTPAAQQSNKTIVVRPAGRTRDTTAAGLDSARRALARGQTGVAISRLQALLERRPELGEARILLARTLLASGRPRRAEALLADGLERDPENHQLAFWLARNRLEQNRPEAALETLQAQSPALEEAPDFHLLVGATLRQLERHEQALEAYRRITEAFPDNARAWLGQALSTDALGRADAARAAYLQALEHGDARTAQLARRRLNVLDRSSQGIE